MFQIFCGTNVYRDFNVQHADDANAGDVAMKRGK